MTDRAPEIARMIVEEPNERDTWVVVERAAARWPGMTWAEFERGLRIALKILKADWIEARHASQESA